MIQTALAAGFPALMGTTGPAEWEPGCRDRRNRAWGEGFPPICTGIGSGAAPQPPPGSTAGSWCHRRRRPIRRCSSGWVRRKTVCRVRSSRFPLWYRQPFALWRRRYGAAPAAAGNYGTGAAHGLIQYGSPALLKVRGEEEEIGLLHLLAYRRRRLRAQGFEPGPPGAAGGFPLHGLPLRSGAQKGSGGREELPPGAARPERWQ